MRKQRAERLRFAVNSLPPETKRAMLDGINENRIVTGANTDHRGGLCPMLAADRNAFQVTPMAEIFATAWDKYTGTSFVNVTRRTACDRDLGVLRSMLETSLTLDGQAHAPATAAVAIPAPVIPQAVLAEIAETSHAATVSARLEVIRALEASGQTRAMLPAPKPAAWVEPAPTPSRRERGRRAAAATARYATAPSGRPPATKTNDQIDRQRAREIVANQASTLRKRAWPRPGKADVAPAPVIAAAQAVPVAATPAPAPRGDLRELAARSGWTWLRPFHSYEDMEQTLTDLGETQRGPGVDDGGVHRDDTKRAEPARA